ARTVSRAYAIERTDSLCSERLQELPPRTAWMCESFSPGTTRRPPRSMTSVASAAYGASCWSVPTATTRPAAIATASASGGAWSPSANVVMRPPRSTRSTSGRERRGDAIMVTRSDAQVLLEQRVVGAQLARRPRPGDRVGVVDHDDPLGDVEGQVDVLLRDEDRQSRHAQPLEPVLDHI